MTGTKMLQVLVCFALAAALPLAWAHEASAKTKRVAVAIAVKGTVQVLKSGGSKPFKAFKNMSLNEGDQIVTGKNGSIKLELSSSKADQDEVTIGPDSKVTFTKLKEEKGVKAKLSIWAGSLWIKVKSVANATDQFEVETPTTIMGVRGTQFFVSVDPRTQISRLAGFAGVVDSTVEYKSSKAGEAERLYISPTEQLISYPDRSRTVTYAAVNELGEFAAHISNELLTQILQDARAIQQEQRELIRSWEKQLAEGGKPPNGRIHSMEQLEAVKDNMQMLLSLLAQQAQTQQKYKAGELEQLVNGINAKAGETVIDLGAQYAMKLTGQQLAEQQKQQSILKEREQLADEEAKKAKEQEQIRKLLEKVMEEQRKREEENIKILEKLKKDAEEKYKEQLAEKERERFEEDKRKRDEESADNGTNTRPLPYPYPDPKPEVNKQPGASLAFPGLTNHTVTADPAGTVVDLEIGLHHFAGNSSIYGLQLELEYDAEAVHFDLDRYQQPIADNPYRQIRHEGPFKVDTGSAAGQVESVDQLDQDFIDSKGRLLYSVTKFTGSAVSVTDDKAVLRLPFIISMPAADTGVVIPFKLVSVTAVDQSGNAITNMDLSGNTIQLQVLHP